MNKEKIYRISICAILIAIIIVMAFTPAGYLKIGLLSITFLTIPIIIGAVSNGPAVGALLGFVFGLTSFIQCFGMDAFGVALMQISPAKTAFLCIVPRTLMGYICGLVFWALTHRIGTIESGKEGIGYIAVIDRKSPLPLTARFAVAAVMAPLFNTILFMGTLLAFFWKTDYIQGVAKTLGSRSVIQFLIAMVGINGIVELVVCSVIGTLILIALNKAVAKFIVK